MKNKKTKLAPTPETDAESFDARGLVYCCHVVPEDFAQKLERERDQWRECAERLHEAVCYLEPALLYDDCEGGFTNERAAVREFTRMKETSK